MTTTSAAARQPAARPSRRRQQLLDLAANLFAERGFHGVSVTDLGAAAGISGPALYKHFSSKDAILAEMLIQISDELLTVGTARAMAAAEPRAALRALVEFHVDFALNHTSLIVVQDRDWASLPDEAREQVRTTQRRYVALWADLITKVRPGLTPVAAKAVAHATFGLINSTPRSSRLPMEEMQAMLMGMALRALDIA